MLTVKHIKQDGSENIYSCNSVRYVPDDGSKEAFGNAGLYLDPAEAVTVEVVLGEDSDGTIHTAQPSFSSRIAIPVSRCGSTEDKCRPEAFVMNDKGATIARYPM